METPPLLPRVEQTIFDGQPAWIKRPEETRSSRFVILHKILQHIMPKVLHPTGALGGMDAIRQEAKRLEIFDAASLARSESVGVDRGQCCFVRHGQTVARCVVGNGGCAAKICDARTCHAWIGCGSCRGSFAWPSVSKGHDCGRG